MVYLCYVHCVWNFFKWKKEKKNRGKCQGSGGSHERQTEGGPLGRRARFCCQTDWPVGQVNLIFVVHCVSWPSVSLELKPSECQKFLKEEASRPWKVRGKGFPFSHRVLVLPGHPQLCLSELQCYLPHLRWRCPSKPAGDPGWVLERKQ